MKSQLLLIITSIFLLTISSFAQTDEILFNGFSKKVNPFSPPNSIRSPETLTITDPPSGPVRTPAEWEELEAIVITWAPGGGPSGSGIRNILREIVRLGKEEVEVIIVCSSAPFVTNLLTGVGIDTENITFIEDDFDTIWIRDYGPSVVYDDAVGERFFIDWIYNRNRPDDNETVPQAIANLFNGTIYSTTEQPYDLVHTGGNFMSDGMGTGFSSKLVLNENKFPGNDFGISNHSEEDIQMIMNTYMGIDRYHLMEELEYDVISHIDMHMKLLDEETLLVGEYPEGVADGPQIEANLQYILENFQTPYGNPYNVVRIPMPPGSNGQYPDYLDPGEYRTYTNALFVNKTILVPTYEEEFDTTGLRIWREAMPGYHIQGINSNAIIPFLGAIHCITKEVGIAEPLLINHARIRAGCFGEEKLIEATIQHISGIASADLFYTQDTSIGYQSISMVNENESKWVATIPEINEETEIYYYISATAMDGKEIVRPLVAPQGYFHYSVKNCNTSTSAADLTSSTSLGQVYPNPANGITVIPIQTSKNINATIEVTDILGRTIDQIFSGRIPIGEHQYFLHANQLSAGTYFINLKTSDQLIVQKLMVL